MKGVGAKKGVGGRKEEKNEAEVKEWVRILNGMNRKARGNNDCVGGRKDGGQRERDRTG